MNFFPCSTITVTKLVSAGLYTSGFSNKVSLGINKLYICDYDILFIENCPLNIELTENYPFERNTITTLHKSWKSVCEEAIKDSKKVCEARRIIEKIGEAIPLITGVKSNFLYRLKNDIKKTKYFILLPREAPFPIHELSILSTLYQLDQDSIPIHSCGVVHREFLFLFGGPSGAGKSTVSNLSTNHGDWILDEDQLLLLKGKDTFFAQAWGYSLQKCDFPIRAIFKLVKDTENQLYQLSTPQTIQFLYERILEITGYFLNNLHHKKIFSHIAEFARIIPCYELHFTKSPDFWDLIDAEFGD